MLNATQYRFLVKEWVRTHSRTEVVKRLDKWVAETIALMDIDKLEQGFKKWVRGEFHPSGGYAKLKKAELPSFITKNVSQEFFKHFFEGK